MIQNSWERFYTPQDLAENILSLLPEGKSFKSAADICGGSGNLLQSVQTRFRTAKLLAIDIDKDAIRNLDSKFNRITTYCADAKSIKELRTIFASTYGFNNGADLIVANPPFGPLDRKIISNLDEEKLNLPKGLLWALHDEAKKLGRIEAFMLISNVYVLKTGGVLASIIPENFFSSERWVKFRKIFLEGLFKNIYVGKATEYFPGSNVKTRIFIGRLEPRQVSADPLMVKNNVPSTFELFRGSFVSKHSQSILPNCNQVPVFHSKTFKYLNNNKRDMERRIISKADDSFKRNAVLKKNDIVLIRVGRNCGNAASIKNRFVGWHVTECIYIIRGIKENPDEVAKTLQTKLVRKKRGLTASYITRNDILKALKDYC